MNRRAFRYVAVVAGSAVLGAALWAQNADDGGAAKPAEAAQAAPAPVDPAKVVISFGNSKITAGEFSAYVASLPPDVRELAQGSGRRSIGEEYVKVKLLAGMAKERKIDQSPRFLQQMEIMKDNILIGMLLQELQPTLASEDDIKKYYEDHKADLERVTARHILISTMSEEKLSDEEQAAKDAAAKTKAEEIRKKLVEKPDDFAEVAKVESQDPGSQKDGGDLPPFSKGQMVPEFETAAFSIKPGDISEVIKTPFGYHIIQVKKREIPSYDEVKEQIGDEVRHEKFEQMWQDLKTKSNPQLDETFFGPPPAPEAAEEEADKAAEEKK